MKNKVLSMTLCAALIFTMLATPQIQPPAHAEAATLTATVIAVAVTLIVAAGVTWTSVAMGKQCTTQFLTDKPEAKQIVEDIVAAMPQTGVLVLTKTMLPKVKQFMKMVGEYFKGRTSIDVPSGNVFSSGNVKYTDLDYEHINNLEMVRKYSFYDVSDLKDHPLIIKTKDHTYQIISEFTSPDTYPMGEVKYKVDGGTPFFPMYYYNDRYHHIIDPPSCPYFELNSTVYRLMEQRIGFRLLNIDGNYVLQPFMYCRIAHTVNGLIYYEEYFFVPKDRILTYFINLSSIGDSVKAPVDVDTINIGNIDDVNEAIAHSVGQAADGVKVDIQKLIEEIEAAKEDALPWTVEGVRELIGIQDELREIAREQERIKDAIKEGTKEDDMSVPQLPTTITEKFPFCVPFDLIALAKTFSAEPVAPKVTIPVVFESMHYSHDFVFDFSGDNWDKVAAVIRWGTLIFFILGLTLVTRKLIRG